MPASRSSTPPTSMATATASGSSATRSAPGAPSQWGDSSIVEITSAGLIAHVATSYQRYGKPSALTTRPDAAVQLTVEDFLTGRDPVLERALRLR